MPKTVLVLLLLVAGASASTAGPGGAKGQLDALLAEAWEAALRENPLLATATGDHRFDDRLPSMTPADLERRAAYARALLERLRAVDPEALPPTDRVSYRMFDRRLRDDLTEHELGAWRIPIDTEIAA